jgi:hypothetical protein
MSILKSRPREEGEVIKPFTGLEFFEELLEGSSLIISWARGEAEIYPSNPYSVSSLALDSSAFVFKFNKTREEVAAICNKAGFVPSDINFVVMVRDQKTSTLHEVEVLSVTNGLDIGSEIKLIGRQDSRCRIMVNRYTGFKFEFYLVLGSDIQPRPLKPNKHGSILAKTDYYIDVVNKSGGLSPFPLTKEIREMNDLPGSTWFWVEQIGDSLLEAASLKDAFRIYVDEELLTLMGRMSGSARALTLNSVISAAMTQIIYGVSTELGQTGNEDFKFEDNSSAVLRMLFKKFTKVDDELTRDGFVALLRDKPTHAISYGLSQLTGSSKTKIEVKHWINDLLGEENVPTS